MNSERNDTEEPDAPLLAVSHDADSMSLQPTSADPLSNQLPARRVRPWEIAAVIAISACLLIPGVWRYSLVDPWETHYAEVARRMLQDNDLVHTKWQNEGFRSKPVFTFWLIAGSMGSMGIGTDGGHSGEMVSTSAVMLAVRLPFVMFGILGLVMMWWMLAGLVRRRVAWLAYLVIATTPFYFFIARQAITDMPPVACLMGAIACFAMAAHAGDERLGRLWKRVTGYHVFLAVVTVFIGWQALYYMWYFGEYPRLGNHVRFPRPDVILPVALVAALAVIMLWRHVLYLAPLGIVVVALAMVTGQFVKPELHGLVLPILLCLGAGIAGGLAIELYLRDRSRPVTLSNYAPAAGGIALGLVAISLAVTLSAGHLVGAAIGASAGLAAGFPLARLQPVRSVWPWRDGVKTKRQLYMLWFFLLCGVSFLAKGLPAIGIAAATCLFYLILTGHWRLLLKLEIPRGVAVCLLVAVPWHVAMWLKDGQVFLQQYFVNHLWKRAAVGVHGDRGTFDYFQSQIGIGLWPWVALLPAAAATFFMMRSVASRESRVRLLVGIWAIIAVATFSLVQTKFHHYIFPAIPALGVLIAFWLDDVLAGRIRHGIGVMCLAAAIILVLILRDLVGEQKQFIELFVYRYDRPWPSSKPWEIDLSPALLLFGATFTVLALLLAIRRLRLIVVQLLTATCVAFALWAMNWYMADAAQHWGQRAPIRAYYHKRTIHGIDIRYSGLKQLAEQWRGRTSYAANSLIPDSLEVGQPMSVTLEVTANDGTTVTKTVVLTGTVSQISHARFEVKIGQASIESLAPVIEEGLKHRATRRPPIVTVNADRLIAWQLYWRGENFWSGDEIYGPIDDMKTVFKETDNKAFLKYLNKPERAGRTYYIITEAGRAAGLKNILPTANAKKTYRVEDRSCNKFTLVSFTL